MITIAFGAALTIQGLVGYLLAEAQAQFGLTGTKGLTALIPSLFGVVLMVCGVLARREHLRKHVMHAAVLVGLIGFLTPAIMAAPKLPALFRDGHVTRPDGSDATLAVEMQLIMAVICLVFVGLCVNSFVQARLLRKRAEQPEAPART
jgi:hypothetical protein